MEWYSPTQQKSLSLWPTIARAEYYLCIDRQSLHRIVDKYHYYMLCITIPRERDTHAMLCWHWHPDMPPPTCCHHEEQFLIFTSQLSGPTLARWEIFGADFQNGINWNQSSSDQDKMISSQIWCEWLVMCQSQYGLSAKYSDAISTSYEIIVDSNQLDFSHLNPRLAVWIYMWIQQLYIWLQLW